MIYREPLVIVVVEMDMNRAIIDSTGVRTFFEGVLGAIAFNAYNSYEAKQTLKRMEDTNVKQALMIQALELKLKQRTSWW